MRTLKICIAPLDWGLGHATRCIVLAKTLQSMGHTIYIASEGAHAVVLKEALPNANHLLLKGYRVQYSKKRFWLMAHLMIQIPKILKAIYYEHQWLQKQQAEHTFDVIISDNRFGMFTKNAKSIFVTHQLCIQTPWRWATSLIQKIQYSWLQHFNECWIPDLSNKENSLSGILAHPEILPTIPVFYIGTLSRLYQTPRHITLPHFSFLVLVSGPEPQRTLFEKRVWEEIKNAEANGVVVAGRPQDPLNKMDLQFIGEKCVCLSHVDGATLASLIDATDIVISRGGYTSLMELVPFNKQLIMVPTPGQTEQEYLGKLWQEKKWALCFDQEASFSIKSALQLLDNTSLEQSPFEELNLELIKARLD
jgi:spore coat polysaccharide biosynthesis predicted glycosyltransferase SpsG